MVLKARVDAMAVIRKLDQRVRDLSYLELFYDLQTDRAAAASALVELIATADAAANHLPIGAAGVVICMTVAIPHLPLSRRTWLSHTRRRGTRMPGSC